MLIFNLVTLRDACLSTPGMWRAFQLSGTYEGDVMAVPEGSYTALQSQFFPGVEITPLVFNAVQIVQPLGFPSSYIAYGSNPNNCYRYSAFLGEYTGSGTSALVTYPDTGLCGSPYLYSQCAVAAFAGTAGFSGTTAAEEYISNQEIVVVYPPSTTPHTSVEYGSRCFSYVGPVAHAGTLPSVAVGSVTARLGCGDYYCSGTDPLGDSVVYFDSETEVPVGVHFQHLTTGIPRYGVAGEKIDVPTGLLAGQATVRFDDSPEAPLFSVATAGQMLVKVGLPGVDKHLIVTHASSQTLFEVGHGTQRLLNLVAGDAVTLSVADIYGKLPVQFTGLTAQVSWTPIATLPRLYDSVSASLPAPSAIQALGFCGYTDQSAYAFYGTLPAYASMTGPVNPDSLVTVSGSGTEYLLVCAAGVGDAGFSSVASVLPYGGQAFSGSVMFNFYAGRTAAGAHGEMDVWLASASGTFPGFLRAGYRSLWYDTVNSYRKVADPTDTTRNGYYVASGSQAHSPSKYINGAGQVISAESADGTIAVSGTTFIRIASDLGLAYSITSSSSIGT